MKEIGISVYPDFDSIEIIKRKLDNAKELGYQRVFTSIQLGVLGFENASIGISEGFKFLFDYGKEIGLILHVDINDQMFDIIGATPSNLKPLADLNIPVVRLDSGFTNEEAALMTMNPYGIIIEDNASMLSFPKDRIETILKQGNINNYYACHNYFPRIDTGLSYDDALAAARLFKNYGVKVGVFIGSLDADKDLNASGKGVLTIEDQRYLPSHVQAMELFVHHEYDYVIFGDSNPSQDELVAVAKVASNGSDLISEEQRALMPKLLLDEIKDMYCIEIPVWLDSSLDQRTKELLTSIVFIARFDQSENVVRGTESREVILAQPHNCLYRNKYSITIDNSDSNRYEGELQIMLKDLAPACYANVIGMVKPYGQRLVELSKYGKVLYKLKEE